MNIFNRGVMILLILKLLVVIPVALIIFLVFPTDALTYLKAWLTSTQGWLTPENYLLSIGLGAAFGGLVWFFLLLLLVSEVFPRRKKSIKVPMVEGGEARLHVDSIVQRLRYEVDRLPDVVSVRPQVQSKGSKGVNVTLDVVTAPTVDIPTKTQELVTLVRDQVETRMGIRVDKVAVNIKHSSYGEPQKQV
jgi:uncharacterized alkaline shock family protein YloU